MTPVVWITGCRGFIGRHVARHLSAAGHLVHGIGHGAWTAGERTPWGVTEWVNGDITAGNLAALAAATGRPSFVVHLAGGSSVGSAIAQPREDFARTVVATANLLEWVRLHSPDSAVAAASSAAVYGTGHSGPIAEGVALRPYSPYGHHKLIMEQLCRSYGAAYGVRSVALRFFSVYGPELRKQLLWDACEQLAKDPAEVRLGGTGDEMRDWVHVRDAARAFEICVAAASAAAPSINIGTGHGVAVRDIVRLLVEGWSSPAGRVASATFSGKSRAGDPHSLIAQTTAAAAAGFGCEVPLQGGITEYVRWYQSRA